MIQEEQKETTDQSRYVNAGEAGLVIKHKEPEPETKVIDISESDASPAFVEALNQQFASITNDFNRMVEFVNNLAVQIEQQRNVLQAIVSMINRNSGDKNKNGEPTKSS